MAVDAVWLFLELLSCESQPHSAFVHLVDEIDWNVDVACQTIAAEHDDADNRTLFEINDDALHLANGSVIARAH